MNGRVPGQPDRYRALKYKYNGIGDRPNIESNIHSIVFSKLYNLTAKDYSSF
jgi:hypothetical protein